MQEKNATDELSASCNKGAPLIMQTSFCLPKFHADGKVTFRRHEYRLEKQMTAFIFFVMLFFL